MGLTYTQGSDVAQLEPTELAARLEDVVMAGMQWLGKLDDAVAARPDREGKWSAKQVIGHLTDSALNNLGRMVRMQIAAGQRMPGYEQEAWVVLQHYGERDWSQVLAAWAVLNGQMVWVIAHIDKGKLGQIGFVGDSQLTLGFLIEDYIAHMEHHLRAIQSWVG
jgi:hypothetical protein